MAIKPDEGKTVQVVVHPRRSVVHQVPAGTRLEAGKSVPVFAQRTAIGGEMIEVPIAEAAFLRAHGFLHEPNAPVLLTQTGQAPLPATWSHQEFDDGPKPTVNGDDGTIVRAG